jgi:rhodanese-related sulfurtransferase
MIRWVKESLWLVAITVLCAVATWFWHPLAPPMFLVESPALPDEVSMEDIRVKFDGRVQWVDARSDSAFTSGHIPGAWPLSPNSLESRAWEYFERMQQLDVPVVVYCDSLACDASREVKDKLSGWGLRHEPLILRDGWKAWTESGGAIASGPP